MLRLFIHLNGWKTFRYSVALLTMSFHDIGNAAQARVLGQVSVPINILRQSPGANEDIVTITAVGGNKRIVLRERPDIAIQPYPLPLFFNLLEMGSARIFGDGRRCAIEHAAGTTQLLCQPGNSISGARLVFSGHRLPTGAAIDMRVWARAGTGFAAEVTAQGADADSPQTLRLGMTRLALPDLPGGSSPQLVLIAPEEGGTLDLTRLELVASASRPGVDEVSAWAWNPALWQGDPAPLIASAVQRRIRRLFVTLDVEDGKVRHVAALRRFVRAAARSGIEVEAVEGDPHMVLASGLPAALARARAFTAYQQTAGEHEKLAGLQYDVEPYVLPEWGKEPATYKGWADAILQLSHAAREPVDLVLPFRLIELAQGRELLRRTKAAVRGVTIMSYRTQASSLAQIAEPFLAWGTREGKPIRLALEAGPIEDEVEQVYREAPFGTLAVLPGSQPQILILEKPSAIAGARMFRAQLPETVRGDRISFLGEEARMMEMARRTTPAFSSWPSFAGFALHGLEWPISQGR